MNECEKNKWLVGISYEALKRLISHYGEETDWRGKFHLDQARKVMREIEKGKINERIK